MLQNPYRSPVCNPTNSWSLLRSFFVLLIHTFAFHKERWFCSLYYYCDTKTSCLQIASAGLRLATVNRKMLRWSEEENVIFEGHSRP